MVVHGSMNAACGNVSLLTEMDEFKSLVRNSMTTIRSTTCQNKILKIFGERPNGN